MHGKGVVDYKEWLILSCLHSFLGKTTRELEWSFLFALAALITNSMMTCVYIQSTMYGACYNLIIILSYALLLIFYYELIPLFSYDSPLSGTWR